VRDGLCESDDGGVLRRLALSASQACSTGKRSATNEDGAKGTAGTTSERPRGARRERRAGDRKHSGSAAPTPRVVSEENLMRTRRERRYCGTYTHQKAQRTRGTPPRGTTSPPVTSHRQVVGRLGGGNVLLSGARAAEPVLGIDRDGGGGRSAQNDRADRPLPRMFVCVSWCVRHV